MKNEEKINCSNGNVRFIFADRSFADYDRQVMFNINPYFFTHLTNDKQIEISLPDYINENLLIEYFFLVKKGLMDLQELELGKENQIISLIKISEYFQNEKLSALLISSVAMQQVSPENVFLYLKFSYEKMNSYCEFNGEYITLYFDLFYKCLEIIGNNLNLFMNNLDIIKKLEKKIIDELMQKLFSNILRQNYILCSNSSDNSNISLFSNEIEREEYFESNIEITSQRNRKAYFISVAEYDKLINFLLSINKLTNFFELLTNEQTNIFSIDNINELNNLPNPTFKLNIPFDFGNYYQEYPINLILNNNQITFVLFYKKSDDSFNVCIKLANSISEESKEGNYFFKIFSLLAIVNINNEPSLEGKPQVNLKCLCNNKSMHSIFKVTNFKKNIQSKLKQMQSRHTGAFPPTKSQLEMNEEGFVSQKLNSNRSYSINSEDFFSVIINLRLCFIHSALCSYFINNFCVLHKDKSITKISKQLLLLVIKHKYLNKKSEDDILNALLNWLDDEINIKEEINELFDVIKWDKVKEELIFEFIMKYAHMISIEESGKIFARGFNSKYSERSIYINQILSNFFKAAKKIDYNNIFTKMKTNEKYNQVYLSLFNPKQSQCTLSLNDNSRSFKSFIVNRKKSKDKISNGQPEEKKNKQNFQKNSLSSYNTMSNIAEERRKNDNNEKGLNKSFFKTNALKVPIKKIGKLSNKPKQRESNGKMRYINKQTSKNEDSISFVSKKNKVGNKSFMSLGNLTINKSKKKIEKENKSFSKGAKIKQSIFKLNKSRNKSSYLTYSMTNIKTFNK